MIGKIITIAISLSLLAFSLGFLYQNMPRTPVDMAKKGIEAEPVSWVDYGVISVFEENLRFNHNDISYFISEPCSKKQRDAMVDAFRIFSEKMEIITFHEGIESRADILVGCSENFIPMGENLFAAGEGGPSKIINSTQFNLIQEGKISIYEEPRCEYPIVEIHELGHVFGFDHSPNPDSAMYNISGCNQRITQDMIRIIKNLYSIEPLANAKITSLSATKKGKYLDFNVSITNDGLVTIENTSLVILGGGRVIDDISLGEVKVGYERTVLVKNLKLHSSSIKDIDFVIDKENKIRELNEVDNRVQMTVSSQ
jgi:hypothetical protein